MKRRSFLPLLVATLGISLTGCVTSKEASLPIEQTRVYTVAREVLYLGAVADLRLRPTDRLALERASAGLDALVAQKRWDLAAAAQALTAAGITQASSQDALLVIQGVTTLYDLFAKKPLDLSTNRTAEAYVRAANDALKAALGVQVAGLPRSRVGPGEIDPQVAFLFHQAAESTRGR